MGHAAGVEHGAERRSFVAGRGGRLDALIAGEFADLTRARVQRLITAGAVRLNGVEARKSASVAAGDAIEIVIAPVAHERPEPGVALQVLYEDGEVVAIDKPAGLVVHGAPGDLAPSVAGWFLARYPEAAERFDAERPGVVHRLDKETSGVLLLAKTPAAQAALSEAFAARETEKQYVALCEGVPAKQRAVIDAAIARHPGDRTRMAVTRDGRASRTEYEVLGASGGRSLLLVKPETGRTHQIRVHLAAIGVPVVDDAVYGRKAAGPGRQLLHAWRLRVPHPRGGTLTVTAPLPADMLEAIRAAGLAAVASPYAEPVPATLSDPLPAEQPS